MSFYNLIHGQNPMSELILATLNLTKEDVGRFRDCFVEDNQIAVYTRNGGGNRDHWEYSYPDNEPGENCPCVGCYMEYRVHKHPNYIRDRDDDYDSTYATIYYSFPEEHKDFLETLVMDEFKPDERWLQALSDLENGKLPKVVKTLKPIIKKISNFMKND